MRTIKTFFAGILCLSCLFLVPASFAGNEFASCGRDPCRDRGKAADPDRQGFEEVGRTLPGNTTRATGDTPSS